MELSQITNYFYDLQRWGIPLDWAFEFYLPDGCEYDKLRTYGIASYKDLLDHHKFSAFINSYVPEYFEDIRFILQNTFIFKKEQIIYKRTFTFDDGSTHPILIDPISSDRLDRIPSNALYFHSIQQFGLPPNKDETFQAQQIRLRDLHHISIPPYTF
jgi:hypothetical protein